MSGGWLRRPAILFLLALVTAMPASAGSPGSELERLADADHTFISPDGQIRVEQYSWKKDEDDRVYQFWTFDQNHQYGTALNLNEDTDLAGPCRISIQPRQPIAGADAEARRRLSHAVSVPAEWRSIFTGDPETPGRHGLGLFLQPAGLQENASEIQRSRFAQSLAGASGPGDGGQLRRDGKALA
jgi:hypothetical protein